MTFHWTRSPSLWIAAVISLIGLTLVVHRGGLLAWTAAVVGLVLIAKSILRPSMVDLRFAVGIAATLVLVWAATLYYVVSTWESGEVVELVLDTANGSHRARVWVLETGRTLTLIYDAEPDVAQSLAAATVLTVVRDGVESARHARAVPMDTLPQAEVDEIFQLMIDKYGGKNRATDIFYSVLGRPRDRVVMIVTLDERLAIG